MLITRSAISPPTITIANGRCESEPIAWDKAAGNNPELVREQIVQMMTFAEAQNTAAKK